MIFVYVNNDIVFILPYYTKPPRKSQYVNRALYKRIKSMNRAEMEFFVKNIFNQGYEKAESETRHIDYNSLKANLSQIKGIGESRLNEIKTDDLMRFQLKNLHNIEWYDKDNIKQLEKWGFTIIQAN